MNIVEELRLWADNAQWSADHGSLDTVVHVAWVQRASAFREAANLVEADPDFKMRERVKALVFDLELPYAPGLDRPTAAGMARRIRQDVLGEKP